MLMGAGTDAAAQELAGFGAAKVLVADDASLGQYLALHGDDFGDPVLTGLRRSGRRNHAKDQKKGDKQETAGKPGAKMKIPFHRVHFLPEPV